MDFLSFVGAGAIVAFALTGAYPWMRYGYDGVKFIWSREFSASLRMWQMEKVVIKSAREMPAIDQFNRDFTSGTFD